MTNLNSIRLKAKKLLRFYSGCHGDLVTTAARYKANTYCLKEALLKYDHNKKNKELIGQGNWVTIATKYVADAYCPKESPYQIQAKYDLSQRSY